MTPADSARFESVRLQLKNATWVELRWLQLGDEQRLGDFYASVPRADYRFYRCQPLGRELAKEIAAKADSATAVHLLAVDPATAAIVGYAWYTWDHPDAAQSVFGICLRPSHQGTGLGKALMTQLLAAAKVVGPPLMTLTVQLANPRAVHLYQQMGFDVVREQMRNGTPDFPPEPEYYMERRVRTTG